MSGMFSSSDTLLHNEFMGFVIDDASLIALRDWAERQGYPHATVQQGGPDMFAQLLESAPAPHLAVLDIDGQADPIGAAARLAGMCGKDCRLVIVGSTNDVGLYHRLTSAGAVDYLVKPLTAEQLNQTLAAALRGGAGNKQEAKEARIVAVIGSRGGAGASTIALNAAWLLAHRFARNTALLDLDLQFGTSALALDLEPGRGLRDIAGSPHRVDSLMISSSMVPESDLFSVLGAEESVDDVIPMDGGAMTALLKEMKGNFEVIVVDMPHFLFAAQKRVLTLAQEIVIVSELSLSGIRDTLRLKNAINLLGCTARVTTVASRTDAGGNGQVDRAAFEKGIQGKIDATIPEDGASVASAANSGKALGETAPRAPITKALSDLAVRLAAVEDTAVAKPSFWEKIWNKGKGLARSKA
ncbi:MAG: AAA family ATPase [Alphaproteobacteria bacterium]|nr:AAA family ATPase [Alphaproteobacteria bacterium]